MKVMLTKSKLVKPAKRVKLTQRATPAKAIKQTAKSKRLLFSELIEGMEALAAAREGKLTSAIPMALRWRSAA
jgi:hypothetical protein